MQKNWYMFDAGSTVVHKTLFSHVIGVEQNQSFISNRHLENYSLYLGHTAETMYWGPNMPDWDRKRENLISSIVDTLSSKFEDNFPLPMCTAVTSGWTNYRKAKRLSRWLEVETERLGLQAFAGEIMRDVLIFGFGALLFNIDEDRNLVTAERILPDNIIVDHYECRNRPEPRQYHYRRLVNRHTLKALYPHLAKEIDDAGHNYLSQFEHRVGASGMHKDLVAVITSWFPASRPNMGKKTDGRVAMVIDNATISYEPYEETEPPIKFFRYGRPISGWYADPLVSKLRPFQDRLDQIDAYIEHAQDVNALPKLLIPKGSKVELGHLRNNESGMPAAVYQGLVPPQAVIWPTVPNDIYNERERIQAQARAFAGISELSTSGVQKGDFDSSKSIRAAMAIGDGRLSKELRRNQADWMEAHHCLIKMARTLKPRNVAYHRKSIFDQIDWVDIDMDNDAYQVEVAPVNPLSATQAARIEEITALTQSGALNKAEAMSLMHYGDLDHTLSLESATIENADATIEKLEKGVQMMPSQYQDLQTLRNRVHQAYMRVQHLDDVPAEVKVAFENYLTNIDTMFAKSQQAAQQQALQQQIQLAQAQNVGRQPQQPGNPES